MPRFVPPAGVPLPMRQILTAFGTLVRSNGSTDQQLQTIAARLKAQYIFGTSSGRAALYLTLRSLHRLRPDRDIVALPAYTCFSVPAAVVRAGLKLYPVDVNLHTLDFEPSALEAVPEKKLLCIVTSNLFGFLNDLPYIQRLAKSRGAFVIDDAAQALGSRRNGCFAEALGDVGIYSLGRGKALTALEGGLIVTNSELIAEAIREEAKCLKPSTMGHGVRLLIEMLMYSVFLRPNLYWMPNSLPFLKLGFTEFNPGFPIEELHPLCRALLDSVFDRLEDMNHVRRANATSIAEALPSTLNFEFPKPAANTMPTFIRMPVIARDKEIRERAVRRLRNAGMGAGAFYPTAICEIPGIEAHMSVRDFHRIGAERLSDRLFSLPVNPLLTLRDRNRMIDLLATI